jgi:hypothetical protein
LLSADGCKQMGDEAMDIPLRQQSEKEIVQQLYKNDNITREVCLFLSKYSKMLIHACLIAQITFMWKTNS